MRRAVEADFIGSSVMRIWALSAWLGVVAVLAACNGSDKPVLEAPGSSEEAQLRTALSVGDGTARAPDAPDPVQVTLPPKPADVGWSSEQRAAVVTFLSATAPMAGRNAQDRVATCSELDDPSRLRPVTERAALAIDALAPGDARAALSNDYVAKTRLAPACQADAPAWADVAFTHPVAARVVLEVLR